MASVEDYTIGCICALSIEAVALRLFLDEEYKCPEIESSYASTQDHNVYSTGAIGGHKIVVATLPLGKYGVSQATGVIGDMIRSFPNLRCCLVVGIGGGAPSSQNDIRLGDIVVSAPVLKSGGILQYDHGKAIQGQPFRITQHLNEPPSILLSAIGKLAQDYELDEHPLQNMVNDVLATKPRLKMKYQRPDDGSDRLYKSDVTHPIDTRGNCERLCGTEVSKLVERPTRAAGVGVAEIHYGIIASGSSLMKDATVRDRLSDQEEVLCFEMEAAGLVNQFPCLVIRGICDYSDSHKSDEWQGHAAMMAAAYAKEVLRVVLPRKISSTEKIVDKLSAKLNGIKEGIQNLATCHQDIQVRELREQLLVWLPSIDYADRQNALQREMQGGTGQWFLNTTDFWTWLYRDGAILFCPGMPGAGKTHIASLVIHYLQSSNPFDWRPRLAYMYCEYTHQLTRETLLGSLLKQLSRTLHPLPTKLTNLYKDHKFNRTQPSVDELRTVLHDIVSSSKRCFIVVDGIDECPDDEGMRAFLLETLTELRQLPSTSILVMSRDIPHIRDHFSAQNCLEIKVRASDHDIDMYLNHRIPRVLPLLADNLDLQRNIKSVIMTAARGMFLLAMLHVNSLKGKVNVKAIDDALAEVMSGGSSLIAAYDKTMKMIQSQGDEYGKLAKHALSWVAFSDEPLTTSQLQHALAIEPGTTDLVFDNVTKLEIIMSSCAGLVTIQENLRGCSTVHLVHETTQEYLLDTREKWFGDVRARLARLSLTYLTFQAFETGPCELEAYRISRKEKYPLWNYLGRYFARYIEGKSDSEDARVRSMLEKFFLGDAYVVAHVSARVDFFERAHEIPPTSFNLVRFSPHEHAQIGFSEGSTALHLAIFYRFGSLIPLLLQKNARANETNYHGLTALHLAVVSKYHDGIEYLLSAPEVDGNAAVSKDDWTALSHACKAGDEKAVRLLLACHKIDCNLADKSTITPLMWALHRRQLAVVRLLLERKDVDCNGPDKDGLVPLHYAALGNCRECIKELVDRPDLKVNMRDRKGRKPLIWCIEYRFLQPALQLLSRDDVDFTLPNKTERSPLVHAAQWGQPALMEALLDKLGSRIPATDSNGRTILDHAAKWETWQLLQRLLVRCKTRIRVERPFTGTAIFFTIKKGPREVLELLISQMELNDDWWFIHALALSMENNTLECFEVLEKKLRGWMQYYPEWISACLTRVVWKGCDHILASTLRYARHYAAGIDVEEVHFLHGGIGWKDISILEIVFDVPCAQLDVRDRLGQTALHAMARRQDVVATQILLFLGADSSLRDSEGLTAFECASHWPGYLFEWKERLNPDSGWAPP